MNQPPFVEHVTYDGILYAVVVRAAFDAPGIHFFTEPELSQQVAYMHHPAGKVIAAHVHNYLPRDVLYTHEVLIIRSGSVRVDFYSDGGAVLGDRILRAGDTILLIAGGHGFEALEDLRMIEVKQGPYGGAADKTLLDETTRTTR